MRDVQESEMKQAKVAKVSLPQCASQRLQGLCLALAFDVPANRHGRSVITEQDLWDEVRVTERQ